MTASDSVARFTGLAEAYERYRPGYPPEAVSAILRGLPSPATVADIGAGTGISTRALTSAGARAIAIEPNDEMRAIALARGSEARKGTADGTGLEDASVDAVTAFQAFHWFADPAALAEFARIMRRPGRVALVWNERSRDDACTVAFRALERRHGEPAMLPGIDFDAGRLGPLLAPAGFGTARLETYPNAQRLDREAFVGRVRSTSYAPRGGSALERLLADLNAFHAEFAAPDGCIELRYTTEVYLADLEIR